MDSTWQKSAQERMGNCSLMDSRSLTAMSRPLLAPCASSAEYLMVPKGPPVFVLTSKVPAECHLHHNHNNQSDRIGSDPIKHLHGKRKKNNKKVKGKGNIRQTKHERSAALLGNQASQLLLGLFNGFAVLFAYSWIVLRHFCSLVILQQKKLTIFQIEHSKINTGREEEKKKKKKIEPKTDRRKQRMQMETLARGRHKSSTGSS